MRLIIHSQSYSKMSISKLTIGQKTTNQGATPGGRCSSAEFNELIERVNELIDDANRTVYCTQDEYDALLKGGEIQDDVEYNIYEE